MAENEINCNCSLPLSPGPHAAVPYRTLHSSSESRTRQKLECCCMTELDKNWSTKNFPLDQSRGGGGRPYRPPMDPPLEGWKLYRRVPIRALPIHFFSCRPTNDGRIKNDEKLLCLKTFTTMISAADPAAGGQRDVADEDAWLEEGTSRAGNDAVPVSPVSVISTRWQW